MKHYLYDKISSFIMRGCNDLHICDWAFYLPCESLLYYRERRWPFLIIPHNLPFAKMQTTFKCSISYAQSLYFTKSSKSDSVPNAKIRSTSCFLLSNKKKGTIFKKLQLIRTYIDKPLPGRKKSHYSFTNFYWTHS